MPEMTSALVLGMGFGFTTCSFACLPTLAPYLLSFGRGFRHGARSSAVFAAGKTAAYAVLGAAAALAGQGLVPADGGAGRRLHGFVLVLTGIALPFIARDRCDSRERTAAGLSLFAAGFSSSLVPCVPLAALIAAAAGAGSLLKGAGLGLAFGLGITLSPLLIGGGALALVGKTVREEAHRYVPLIRWGAAGVLVLMGTRILL
ncbi:MAG: sulfite exporter TauE/SafE family protein [Nitrospirota bacterium]|nr:sulfite exporter TauE/SafE family protein [Nitrospirota bacterium]